MRLLIADDDAFYRRLLERLLSGDFTITVAADGTSAWHEMQVQNPPEIALLDWVMPGISGIDMCRRFRQLQDARPAYLVLLSAKDTTRDVVAGLRAGADDYIRKPFDVEELKARLSVGRRVLELETQLTAREREAARYQRFFRSVREHLPVCTGCGNVFLQEQQMHDLQEWLQQHIAAQAQLCPECMAGTRAPLNR